MAGRLVNKVSHKFNHWTIIEELGKGKVICQCDCENQTVKELYKKAVINGQTKSCGCQGSGFINLKGQKHNEWTVEEFKGNATWLCRCSCGNTSLLTRRALLEGNSKSCGCKQGENLLNTYKERYGEVSINRIDNPREIWKIEALRDRDKMLDIIKRLGYKPTVNQLSNILDIGKATILVRIHQLELDEYVEFRPTQSEYELELIEYIHSINNLDIKEKDRDILSERKELDIHIPDLNLAIEFNGTYWHSHIYKDSKYHQDKTTECLRKGIRLIHIHEYEWKNDDTKRKILSLIKNIVKPDSINRIYARNTTVHKITTEEAKGFINKYHLQNYSASSVNLGLKDKDGNLLSVMTFGKPRFNNKYHYELIRYCNRDDVKIIGGAEKLFKHFIDKYKPEDIVTYCDISKFTGQVYKRLGFKVLEVTKPNYVWVNTQTDEIFSRYKTQKKKLIELGLGTEDQTEDEIMTNIGYVKVHDSGNLKLQYRKGGAL